jgi:hypothetical protein
MAGLDPAIDGIIGPKASEGDAVLRTANPGDDETLGWSLRHAACGVTASTLAICDRSVSARVVMSRAGSDFSSREP